MTEDIVVLHSVNVIEFYLMLPWQVQSGLVTYEVKH